MDLSHLSEEIRTRFDDKTALRDRGLGESRSAIRACGNAIRAMHRYEFDAADSLMDEAQGHVDAARSSLSQHPDVLYAGFLQDAEKELAEARITFALVRGEDMPSPGELGIEQAPYLKGMAESVGELRRHLLDLLRRGELERCEELLAAMDDIYNLLVTMDYPDGITHGLRRLTDVARSIIERTRGDFTTATIQNSLRAALEDHSELLRGGSS